jgi:Delta7-sterol 5-desaturase
MLAMLGKDSDFTDFAVLWAAAYLALLALYFAVCGFFHRLNKRHPERLIQARPGRNQVAIEIRTSVAALAAIALYVAGGLFIQAKGWALTPLPPTWWSVPLTFVASLVLYDTWFYWGHRLMHSKRLYRFHAHHHRSIAPTPWANNSDSQVGAFAEQAYFLVAPLLLPIPAIVLIAHKIYDQITGIVGHAGHKYFASPTARYPWPMLCTTFHDQHHSHFNYNFANTFSWWDRAMGTIHPTYDARVRAFERSGQATPATAADAAAASVTGRDDSRSAA